jgi:hypothetical protein
MYHRILAMRYPNLLCAFDETQVARFRSGYRHQPIASANRAGRRAAGQCGAPRGERCTAQVQVMSMD